MRNTLIALLLIGLLFSCSKPEKKEENIDHSQHEHETKKEDGEKKPLSPRTASMSDIGLNHVHID